METLENLILIAAGLVGLLVGGNWLVKGAARLASSFGVSTFVIGLTVVAFGTSAPELLVALEAALADSPDIAVGNVVGSNIANVGLILGLAGLIAPINIHWQLVQREIPILIGVSVLAFLLASDQAVSRLDGLLLIGLLAVFIGLSAWLAGRERAAITPEVEQFDQEQSLIDRDPAHRLRDIALIGAGLVALVIGANLLVSGASALARDAGVSELVIGLTLVAVGTSLPELATSIIAALHDENDIVVGNVIGSNIANLLLILSVTALVKPVGVARDLLLMEFPVMLAFSVLLLPFAFDRMLRRWEAAALLTGYAGFMVVLFVR